LSRRCSRDARYFPILDKAIASKPREFIKFGPLVSIIDPATHAASGLVGVSEILKHSSIINYDSARTEAPELSS